MFKTVSAAAAAVLFTVTPALAAGMPEDQKAPVATSGLDAHAQAAQPEAQPAPGEDDIQVVIMGKGVNVQVPNPYKNPKPRMLTDAWAMRA